MDFTYTELEAELTRYGVTGAYVDQTGGGCATVYIPVEGGSYSLGPGNYNWSAPANSKFTTEEFFGGFADSEDEPVNGGYDYLNFEGMSLRSIARKVSDTIRVGGLDS